jgi:hypothetical protein
MASSQAAVGCVVIHGFRPAEGFPARTDDWLKRGLVDAMPDLRLRDLFGLRPGLFTDVEFLVVAEHEQTGQPAAVLGSRWAFTSTGRRFLHIGVQFVASSLRGGSLFLRTWQAHLAMVVESGFFPALSALKTYNPVAYCAMRSYGKLPGALMFPAMDQPGGDAPMATVAGDIAQALAPDNEFDARCGVLRGVGVPPDLYRERPACDDPFVNAYFDRHVRPGDRLLAIVEVHSPQTEDAIMQRFSLDGRARSGERGTGDTPCA